ncbi:MAG: EFR1 family ferrodoxin [Anaerovorax sp.]|nr:EFR1 family ferrodoxin [Anaerovorax sp.]
MDKQLSLIYFSATDTTAKVVKEVANSINNEFKEYNITYPDYRQDSLNFDSNDIVIVGVPVYAGRVPQFLIDYFKKLKGNNTLAVFIVVYGNRDYDDALLELKDTFEENGFIGIAGGAFIGEHSYTSKVAAGRPDENDLKIAEIFGTKINEKLSIGDDFTKSELVVKGKYPYKERTSSILMAPVTNDKCINCGICAEHCPMNAISKDDFKEADSTKCIRCCSCIKRCPVNAKSINHETFAKITQMLLDKCTLHRHEPEYFI